jgi:hypothetical protein
MTTFAELIDQLVNDPALPIKHGGRFVPVIAEMRERVVKLQAAIDDPDGAGELPMIVLEFLEGHL